MVRSGGKRRRGRRGRGDRVPAVQRGQAAAERGRPRGLRPAQEAAVRRPQLCRSSFRYPAVSVRETGICQAPRVLGRLVLKGLPRNDCGWQRRSLTSTPMSSVVSVEYAEVSSRFRLSLHRLSTPDSCGVTITGSALHGRDLGIRLWFMAPSRPVCPRKAARRRGSWSAHARSACTGLGRPGCSPAAAKDAAKSVQLSAANGYEAHWVGQCAAW